MEFSFWASRVHPTDQLSAVQAAMLHSGTCVFLSFSLISSSGFLNFASIFYFMGFSSLDLAIKEKIWAFFWVGWGMGCVCEGFTFLSDILSCDFIFQCELSFVAFDFHGLCDGTLNR